MWEKYGFMFQELVKRDFNKKYKRSVFGVLWSLLSPLLMLGVMAFVFTHFFGRTTPHYTVYLFTGQIIFGYFTEATNSGMNSLLAGSAIYSKINVPKPLFILTSNSAAIINCMFTFVVLLGFIIKDQLFSPKLILLVFPFFFLTLFNLGVSLILGSLYIFFKDIQYLYSVFTRIVMYMSAIFYTIDSYSPEMQFLFHCNPIYVYIAYFREIIIDQQIPNFTIHYLCIGYGYGFFLFGMYVYQKLERKFMYYI